VPEPSPFYPMRMRVLRNSRRTAVGEEERGTRLMRG